MGTTEIEEGGIKERVTSEGGREKIILICESSSW